MKVWIDFCCKSNQFHLVFVLEFFFGLTKNVFNTITEYNRILQQWQRRTFDFHFGATKKYLKKNRNVPEKS